MGNIKLSKGDFNPKLAKQPQKHGARTQLIQWLKAKGFINK